MFRNQKLRERYYDRVRRKVCVKCENPVLITGRMCVNCQEQDREYDRVTSSRKVKCYHSNKLADKWGSIGVIKDKEEKSETDKI
jgi:RNA polymerase subunit RPABC4/transcription elongation factor Spt4